ncbi:MAG: AAA family ATPase [Kiloniellales bacterium]|nr:AAA family ATPase [Kiloniellales bacterium]
MSITLKHKKSNKEFKELVLPASIVGAAKAYLDNGFQPVPLHEKGKPTEGFEYSKIKCITKADVPKWFGKAKGIALRCGTHGGNLVVFDLDCPEAVELATKLLPYTGFIWGRHGQQSHYAYRLEPGVALLKQELPQSSKGAKALVEILGEFKTGTGNLCGAPPTKKADNGDIVEFASNMLPLPKISAEDAVRFGARLATACFLLRHYPEKGARNDYSVAACGALFHSNWSRDDTLAVIQVVSKATGDEENRTANVHSTYDKGEAGDKVTGWPTFKEWLGDDADAAYEVALRVGDQQKPGKDDVNMAALLAHCDMTMAQWAMAEIPKAEPLIEGLIWAGTSSIIFGMEDLGKSLLAIYMAKCLSRGLPFFGMQVPKPRRVILIDAETPEEQFEARLAANICNIKNENFSSISVKRYQRLGGPFLNLDDGSIRKLLSVHFDKVKPDLVILDTATALMQNPDIWLPKGWYAVYNWIREHGSRGCGFTWIAHEPKTNPGAPIGATYQIQVADTTMRVTNARQDEGRRKVTPKKVHFAEKPKPFWYEIVKSPNGQPRIVESAPPSGASTNDKKMPPLKKKVLVHLFSHGWPGNLAKFASLSGVSKSTVADWLNRMAEKDGWTLKTDDGGWALTGAGKAEAEKLIKSNA